MRRRLGQLAGCFGTEMPYNDPHTAAPGLWALIHSSDCKFEVSVAAVAADNRTREGFERLAISEYRIQHGRSPLLNFGRMPEGYLKSSGNNARLVSRGGRFRGGPDPVGTRAFDAPPPECLAGDVAGTDWLGHRWSRWATELPPASARGLYRLRRSGDGALLYVGQVQIRARIPSHRQQPHFANSPECSYVESQLDLSQGTAPWGVGP
jgi:hypothetical protein